MRRFSKIKYRNLPVISAQPQTQSKVGVMYQILTQFGEEAEYTESDIEAVHKFHRALILTLNMRFSLRLKEEFWEVSESDAFSETNQEETVFQGKLFTIYNKVKDLSNAERSEESIVIKDTVLKGPGIANYDKGEYYLKWEKQNRNDTLPGERTTVNVVLYDSDSQLQKKELVRSEMDAQAASELSSLPSRSEIAELLKGDSTDQDYFSLYLGEDPEILENILLNISYKDLKKSVCQTNKTVQRVCKTEEFWRKKVLRDWVPILGSEKVNTDLNEERAELLYGNYQDQGLDFVRDAVNEGNISKVQKLIDMDIDIGITSTFGTGLTFIQTPISVAIVRQNPEMMSILLKAGAIVERANFEDIITLGTPEMLRVILENAENIHDYAPYLRFAIARNKTEHAKLFIEAGVRAENDLHMAVQNGNLNIVEALLDVGADPYRLNKPGGYSAFDLAQSIPGRKRIIKVFEQYKKNIEESTSDEACPVVPYDYYPNFYDSKESQGIYDYLSTLPYDYTYYYFTMRGKRIVKSPRKMIWFAENDAWAYCYTRKHIECLPVYEFTSELRDIRQKVEEFTGQKFNALLVNEYQPTDYLGWHSDDDPWLDDDFIVPSLSFGAERRFQLRNKEDKSVKYTIRLEDGSLIIMKDKCQELWQHQVPKQTKKEFTSGTRYNLTFRYIHPDLVKAQYKRFNRVTWDDMREIQDQLVAGSEYIP